MILLVKVLNQVKGDQNNFAHTLIDKTVVNGELCQR